MDDTGRSVVLGIVLGIALVVAGAALTVRWGMSEVKQAALELPAPLLFIPK